MGKSFTIAFLLLVLAIASTMGGSRSKRQVFIRQREPINININSSPDRSVYARRNFAQPDVVSDVYEVYVGPSNYSSLKEAVVVIQSGGIQGTISFRQERADQPVFIEGTLSGLPQGKHGFHIHQKGDLRDGCKAAGGHFNPYMQPHGAPTDKSRHIGDLGNIETDQSGLTTIRIVDPLISLGGINSIIGRSIVVHEKEDDLGVGGASDSKTTGAAGARLACGIIGLL